MFRADNSDEKGIFITVSTRRSQDHPHTWGWKPWVQSTRHLHRHPTPRASQHLGEVSED
jgi:hypothetical protein